MAAIRVANDLIPAITFLSGNKSTNKRSSSMPATCMSSFYWCSKKFVIFWAEKLMTEKKESSELIIN